MADWGVQSGRSLIIIKSTSNEMTNTKITQVTTYPTTMPLTSSTHSPALRKVSGLGIGASRNRHLICNIFIVARIATVITYLSEVVGGATAFIRIGLAVKPK